MSKNEKNIKSFMKLTFHYAAAHFFLNGFIIC